MSFGMAKKLPSTTRIAWLGNSYIFYNMLPVLVASLIEAPPTAGTAGRIVSHSEITQGGAQLADHASNHRVSVMLQESWDVVVLQDNSQVPGGAIPEALEYSRTALDWFAPFLQGRTRCMLFSTWGHREGSSNFPDAYPDFRTMQEKTSDGYERYAQRLRALAVDVTVVPVGDAFRRVHRAEPKPLQADSLFSRLYVSDGSHPSALGSYLAALVFALVLLPEEVALSSSVPPSIAAEVSIEDARRLRQIADLTIAEAREVGALPPRQSKPPPDAKSEL